MSDTVYEPTKIKPGDIVRTKREGTIGIVTDVHCYTDKQGQTHDMLLIARTPCCDHSDGYVSISARWVTLLSAADTAD
jgi:hypothetical protein